MSVHCTVICNTFSDFSSVMYNPPTQEKIDISIAQYMNGPIFISYIYYLFIIYQKEDSPGDFVLEVRLVWTKIAPSIEKVFVIDKYFQFAGDLEFLV